MREELLRLANIADEDRTQIEAQLKLVEMATSLKIDPMEFNKAITWTDVAKLIEEKEKSVEQQNNE